VTRVPIRELVVTYDFPTDLHLGPQHPGIHGNFAYILKVDGEKIIEAKIVPGYLHRAFEKLMERRTWINNIALIPRVCVPEPDVNEYAFNAAIERIAGWEIPPRAKYIRTVVLEMARISAYLMYLASMGGGVGVYPLAQWAFGDRDYILDLFEALTGARVYHIYMIAGGVRRDIPEGWLDKLEETLKYLEGRLKEYDKLVMNSAVVQRRLVGLAPITPEYAMEHGVTGPNLRATGVPYDLRKLDPYAAYDELDFEVVTEKDGDAWARFMVRRREIDQSIDLIRQLIDKLRKDDTPHIHQPYSGLAFKVPQGEAYVHIESTKGEFGYYVWSDGGFNPYRVFVRGPTTSHAGVLMEDIVVGQELADFSLIDGSFDICPPDLDK
jgi:NADH-quinone oxidoreductase subunit D